MRIKLSLSLNIEKASQEDAVYRDVDVAGTQADISAVPDYTPEDRRIGFQLKD